MKDPEPLAGAHVEPADEAFYVGLALRDAAGPMRCSHNDDIIGHHWRRVQADFSGHQVDFLIVVQLQIDDAIVAEAWHQIPGLGIQSHQPVAGRHV